MKILSVIVPVYNIPEVYLRKCIESILNQSLKEIEILLIDDGSKDNSGIICDQYANLDKRIKVIHKENEGVSVARNIAIDIAGGKYIGFIDADDWIEQDFYKSMVDYAEEKRADIVISGLIKDNDGSIVRFLKKDKQQVFNKDSAQRNLIERKIYEWSPCDKIYVKSLLGGNIRFDKHVRMGEDLDFVWKCIKNSKKIAYIPLHMYHYCVRKGSATQNDDPRKKWDSISVMEKILQELMINDNSLQKKMKLLYIKEMSSSIIDMWKFNVSIYKKEIDNFQEEIKKHINYTDIYIFSLKVIAGILFARLPYRILQYLRCFYFK